MQDLNKLAYYFITDKKLSKNGLIKDVELACKAGVRVVQYRNKVDPMNIKYEEAFKIKNICKKYSVLFIVNDSIDLALALDSDGVHIGQDDLPFPIVRKLLGKKKIIGLSTHSIEEAMIAQFSGANYIGVGSIFPTNTKDVNVVLGLEGLKKISEKVDVPIIAIGGIKEKHIEELSKLKISGFASISSIVTNDNIIEDIKRFNSIFEGKIWNMY